MSGLPGERMHAECNAYCDPERGVHVFVDHIFTSQPDHPSVREMLADIASFWRGASIRSRWSGRYYPVLEARASPEIPRLPDDHEAWHRHYLELGNDPDRWSGWIATGPVYLGPVLLTLGEPF